MRGSRCGEWLRAQGLKVHSSEDRGRLRLGGTMNAGLVACTAVAAVVVAGAATNLTSEARSIHTDTSLSLDAHSSGAASSAQKGRYKTEGDNCVWVANDGGPNQCTPMTRGRFKKTRDASCAWVSNENGPDQ